MQSSMPVAPSGSPWHGWPTSTGSRAIGKQPSASHCVPPSLAYALHLNPSSQPPSKRLQVDSPPTSGLGTPVVAGVPDEDASGSVESSPLLDPALVIVLASSLSPLDPLDSLVVVPGSVPGEPWPSAVVG